MIQTDDASAQLLRRLGIPDDARRVLIFSESSHWDPNWMYTSEEYFTRFVRQNLDQAIAELQREPRRVYAIECMFFLRLYWERCPEKRDALRELVNAGRLRLTGSGVTTADTLLPGAEAILRDWLIGQEWLRDHGMTQEPQLAYFTDSFGCAPTLPSLLRASGFDRTAITRIDGMYFMGCDLESPGHFPRPGSSAERLLNREHSLDFVWRDPNGAQVLCHWNAFTYGQGDMLAFGGLTRVYLFRTTFAARSDRQIANRVQQFTAQLLPYSRTPYMLCPIGFDFVEPIPDLVALLDRYNQNHYPTTGVWAVNAGLDDYLALVEPYQGELPVLELDPNPYWSGFYTARPTLKRQCRELVDHLLLAEKLSLLPENRGAEETIARDLQGAWWQAAVSNHHDFITGTSPDRVVAAEQTPWLKQAESEAVAAIDRLSAALPPSPAPAEPAKPVAWSQTNGRLQIKTGHYLVEMDEAAGGAIVSLQSLAAQTPLLAGLSNDLVSYRDSGGLWRMGFEFAGGVWKESQCANRGPTHLQVQQRDQGLEIMSRAELNGATFRRLVWFSSASPVIWFRIEGIAAAGHSVTVRLATGISAKHLVMDAPGGMVVRPPTRIYHPTFWPLHNFAHLRDDATGRGLAIVQPMPGAISYQPDGTLELVAMRNATQEKAFGIIGIPGNPASGHETEIYAFEYALVFTQSGDWQENHIHLLAHSGALNPWASSRNKALDSRANSEITTHPRDVWVTAVKPASRGAGIIVRLYSPILLKEAVLVSTAAHLNVTGAFLCDARERDLAPLDVQAGVVQVTMPGTLATLRLLQG